MNPRKQQSAGNNGDAMIDRETVIQWAKDAGIDFQENVGVTGKVSTSTAGSQPIEKVQALVVRAMSEALKAKPLGKPAAWRYKQKYLAPFDAEYFLSERKPELRDAIHVEPLYAPQAGHSAAPEARLDALRGLVLKMMPGIIEMGWDTPELQKALHDSKEQQ